MLKNDVLCFHFIRVFIRCRFTARKPFDKSVTRLLKLLSLLRYSHVGARILCSIEVYEVY